MPAQQEYPDIPRECADQHADLWQCFNNVRQLTAKVAQAKAAWCALEQLLWTALSQKPSTAQGGAVDAESIKRRCIEAARACSFGGPLMPGPDSFTRGGMEMQEFIVRALEAVGPEKTLAERYPEYY